MATFIANCSSAEAACINAYSDYQSTSLRLKARTSRLFFRLCDTDAICYTVKAEIEAAITANALRILDCGKMTLNEPTANTTTDDYGCNDSTATDDFTFSHDFFYKYHPDNEEFMDEIGKGYFAEVGWVDCNNLVYVPENKPTVAVVGPVDDSGVLAYKITVSWNQDLGTMRSIPAREPLAG